MPNGTLLAFSQIPPLVGQSIATNHGPTQIIPNCREERQPAHERHLMTVNSCSPPGGNRKSFSEWIRQIKFTLKLVTT